MQNVNDTVAQMESQLSEIGRELAAKEEGLVDLRQWKARLEHSIATMRGEVKVGHNTSLNGRVRRVLSDEARARIQEAQRKRWAKVHAEEKERSVAKEKGHAKPTSKAK